MIKKRSKILLKVISIVLSFTIFSGTFTSVAETAQVYNTTHQWFITDELTTRSTSNVRYNKYYDNSTEANVAEIISHNELGEIDYTYTISGSIGDASASYNLCYWHNTDDLGNNPYDCEYNTYGGETLYTKEGDQNFVNTVYGFGSGWSLDLPQIEYIDSCASYYHDGKGNAYRIGKITPEDETAVPTYELCDYPYDFTIEEDYLYESEEDTEGTLQGIIGTDKYGNKYYFNLDGRLIKTVDKSGTVLKTITYDEDRLISSISENNYTVNFARANIENGSSITINMVKGEDNVAMAELTVRDGNLLSVVNEVEEVTTEGYTGYPIDVVESTASTHTTTFEYVDANHTIIENSENTIQESSLHRMSERNIAKITNHSLSNTEYTYNVTDEENQEAVARAGDFELASVDGFEDSTSTYTFTYSKGFRDISVYSARRSNRLQKIESSIEESVNPGYDPSGIYNSDVENVANPTIKETSETTVTEYDYDYDSLITAVYSYSVPDTETADKSAVSEDQVEITTEETTYPLVTESATLFDYTIDEDKKAEISERVNETTASMLTVYTAEYTKASKNAEWILDETSKEVQSVTTKNASKDVIYSSNGDSEVYKQYNSNGSVIVEDTEGGLINNYTYDDNQILTKKQFDNYTISYDENGNTTSIKQKDTELLNYTYDSEGNATSETYANGQALRYEYDTNGNISDVYDVTPAIEEKIYHYEYVDVTDDTGKENWVKASITDYRQNRITRNTYGSTGKLYEVSVYAIDNDGESLLYSYTTNEYNKTISFGGHTITTSASYSDIFGDAEDPIGQEGISTISENGKTSYAYKILDEDGVVVQDTIVDNDTEYRMSCSYTYDEDGKLTTQEYDYPYFPNKISYKYNDNDEIKQVNQQGRLDEYIYGTHGQLAWYDQSTMFRSINYAYDERGNVTSRKSYAWYSSAEEDLDTADYFSYTSNTWEDQLTSVNNSAITYDESGNIRTYNGYTYTWENGRQLKSVSNGINTYTYTYDENGYRTSKTINGKTTNYINEDGKILAEYNDTQYRVYWYDCEGSVTGYITGYLNNTDTMPQMFFYKKNQMGDIVGVNADYATSNGEYVYDAWGKVVMITDGREEESEWATEAHSNPFRYRGYYYDTETGFYYLQSRYYNPEWHRFINADDPNKIGETQTPLSVNAYAYCENDPVNYIDSEGTAPKLLGRYWSAFGIALSLSIGLVTVTAQAVMYTNKKDTNIYVYLSGDITGSFVSKGKTVNKTIKGIVEDITDKIFGKNLLQKSKMKKWGFSFAVSLFVVLTPQKKVDSSLLKGPSATTSATVCRVMIYHTALLNNRGKTTGEIIGVGYNPVVFDVSVTTSYSILIYKFKSNAMGKIKNKLVSFVENIAGE